MPAKRGVHDDSSPFSVQPADRALQAPGRPCRHGERADHRRRHAREALDAQLLPAPNPRVELQSRDCPQLVAPAKDLWCPGRNLLDLLLAPLEHGLQARLVGGGAGPVQQHGHPGAAPRQHPSRARVERSVERPPLRGDPGDAMEPTSDDLCKLQAQVVEVLGRRASNHDAGFAEGQGAAAHRLQRHGRTNAGARLPSSRRQQRHGLRIALRRGAPQGC
mmetsp:Transcript_31548/g.98103  ORF Transcript_31548/g.98103 Transcript_31548/m.98103 type:complete len:219 (-) Transcript_31548:22-678(-)